MSNVNKQILIGRLGRDCTLSYSQASGTAINKFSIAVSYKYKDREETSWFNIVCFGKLAEITNKYLQKGSLCYIEGRTKNSSYEDKEGVKKHTSEVIATEVKFLDTKDKTNHGEKSSDSEYEVPDIRYPEDDDLPY